MRLALLAFLTACNLAPKPIDGDDTGTPGDDTGTTSADGPTVFDVRNGDYSGGEQITLEGVLVSSPATYDGEGFFIQDPAGGEKSGLFVWSYNGVAEVYAEPGDEVSVTGTVSEFYGWTEFVISDASAVSITGSGTLPTPPDLGDGAGVDWDAWESVPVTLSEQVVEGVDDYGNGLLSGGIKLDDGIHRLDFDCRDTFASLTGVVFYTYEEWSLNPRSASDATGYTEAEAIPATAAAAQRDGACGPVEAELVATSPVFTDEDGAYFFAQDEGGGEYSGILVFVEDAEELAVEPGWKGTVTGTVNEFYGLTELKLADEAGLVETGTAAPVASVLTEPPADWEPWESCLLTLTGVEVTSDEAYGQVATNWTDLFVDDLLYDFAAGEGDSWSTATGPLWYSYNEWKLVPRDASDLVE